MEPKEEHCKCEGPYTCKEHDGEYRWCANPKCKCHYSPDSTEGKLPIIEPVKGNFKIPKNYVSRTERNEEAHPEQEEWRKVFEQKFMRSQFVLDFASEEYYNAIEDFISSLISKKREKVIREMLEYVDLEVAPEHFNQEWLKAHIKNYAKSIGISLE